MTRICKRKKILFSFAENPELQFRDEGERRTASENKPRRDSLNMFSHLWRRCSFILLAGIILTFAACSDNRPAQENQRASVNKIFVLARNFAPGQLEAHYEKHRQEFGDITQQEYLSRARLLLNSAASRDILEKARRNGDILRYKVSTGEFAVMAKDGRIRTYFKTDYKYWLKQ